MAETLRAVLVPLFSVVPGLALLEPVLGETCYQSVFIDVNLADQACLKLTVSKLLSGLIVLASVAVKVPQIITIISQRSAQGLPLISFLLSLFCYMISVAYNFRNGYAFSTYGETMFIAIQEAIIVVLILWYGQGSRGSRNAVAAFSLLPVVAAVMLVVLTDQLVSKEALQFLFASTIPVLNASRIPLIRSNYVNQSTGVLSPASTFLFALGSLVRVFTTLQEVDDMTVLAGFIIGALLNLILAGQVIYYWGKPAKSLGETQEQATKKKK